MASNFLRGTALLIIWGAIDSTSTNEDELNDWWTNDHLPERLEIPGFLHSRRFYSADDTNNSSKYLVWYEVSSLETLTSAPYLAALNHPTPRTAKYMPLLATLNRCACRVLHSVARRDFQRCHGSGVGATMAHIVFAPPSSEDSRDALRDYIISNLSPVALTHSTALAFHLIEHDAAATFSGSTSKSYRAVRFQEHPQSSEIRARWMILVEFSEPRSAPFAKHDQLVRSAVDEIGTRGAKDVVVEVYELICAMSE